MDRRNGMTARRWRLVGLQAVILFHPVHPVMLFAVTLIGPFPEFPFQSL